MQLIFLLRAYLEVVCELHKVIQSDREFTVVLAAVLLQTAEGGRQQLCDGILFGPG